MKAMAMTGLAVITLAATGCGTPRLNQIDVNKLAEAYYGQDSAAQVFKLSGVNTVSLTGENMTLVVSAPIPPKRMIDLPQSQAAAIAGTISRSAVAATLGYAGIKAMGDTMTVLGQRPSVVDPLIVRPEVIMAGE
jgi:hypothetical protein